jgi:aryl-alcohol dehydrogenase-like predicted oxidoreductase
LERRALGADGPLLTRLGLGLAAIGRPAYLNVGHADDVAGRDAPGALLRLAHEVLDAAYAAGIRYLDAARSYGEAERFLRAWLDARRLAPGAVVVGSKWGYRYVGGWRLDAEKHEVKDHSAAALRAQLEESRAKLGPHLALYQIHSATPESGVLADGEVLGLLAALRDEGVHVGVTASGPSQAETIRRAIALERGGRPLFASVQATWNLLERGCEDALREAHAARRTVIVKEALANGLLAGRHAACPGPLADLARRLEATPDAVALAAVLAQEWADVVLVGATTPEQLRSNVRAVDVRLEADDLAALGAMRERSEDYWERRAGLRWT